MVDLTGCQTPRSTVMDINPCNLVGEGLATRSGDFRVCCRTGLKATNGGIGSFRLIPTCCNGDIRTRLNKPFLLEDF